VADFDVRVGAVAGADAVEEVGGVGVIGELSFDRFEGLVAGPDDLAAGFLAEEHDALSAVEGVAVFGAFLEVGGPDALLVNELFLFAVQIVLEADVLGVGELLVVVEEVFASERRDAVGVCFDAEPPAGDVDVVDAVVADVAAAKVVEPAPQRRQEVALVGDHGCWADPEVVIEVGRGV